MADARKHETKKSHKTSKRCGLKSKKYLLTKTPPKSPCKDDDAFFVTSSKEKLSGENAVPKQHHDSEKIESVDEERYCKLPMRTMSFSLKSGIEENNLSTPSKDDQSSVKITGDTDISINNHHPDKPCLSINTDSFDELSSSHDDVFTSPTTPTWTIGENTWKEQFSLNSYEPDDWSLNLLKNFKLKSLQQQTNNGPMEHLLNKKMDNSFEDLKTETSTEVPGSSAGSVLDKSALQSNSLSSMSSLSTASLTRTSVDRATDTFEMMRAICDKKCAPREHSFQQRSFSTAAFPTRRAFSTSPTNKEMKSNDIPPLIPPREPLRPARPIPPQRHSSSPSACSLSNRSPSSNSSSFSASFPTASNRSKCFRQSSTTPVFSALPPSQTRSNPVILPVMKNGMQESHTHYYLLGEEESKAKSKKPARPKFEPLHSIPRPTSLTAVMKLKPSRSTSTPPPCPPRPPKLSFNFYDLKSMNHGSTSSLPNDLQSRKPSTHLLGVQSPLASEFVEQEKRLPTRFDGGTSEHLVNELKSHVFGVTNEQCQSALRRNDWNVTRSINYLKVEQLFRTFFVSRENCHKILQTTGWNLHSAYQLLLEQYQPNFKTRS